VDALKPQAQRYIAWDDGVSGFGVRVEPGGRKGCQTVRDIRRATRRKFSAEEKIRIVLEGLRGEDSVVSKTRLRHCNDQRT